MLTRRVVVVTALVILGVTGIIALAAVLCVAFANPLGDDKS